MGWPTFSPWRRTSRTKGGPNSSGNEVMQLPPQDGVSATAGSRPTALTPPTMVIVAATAKTFFLIDVRYLLFRQTSHTLRGGAGPGTGPAPPGLGGFTDERKRLSLALVEPKLVFVHVAGGGLLQHVGVQLRARHVGRVRVGRVVQDVRVGEVGV